MIVQDVKKVEVRGNNIVFISKTGERKTMRGSYPRQVVDKMIMSGIIGLKDIKDITKIRKEPKKNKRKIDGKIYYLESETYNEPFAHNQAKYLRKNAGLGGGLARVIEARYKGKKIWRVYFRSF